MCRTILVLDRCQYSAGALKERLPTMQFSLDKVQQMTDIRLRVPFVSAGGVVAVRYIRVRRPGFQEQCRPDCRPVRRRFFIEPRRTPRIIVLIGATAVLVLVASTDNALSHSAATKVGSDFLIVIPGNKVAAARNKWRQYREKPGKFVMTISIDVWVGLERLDIARWAQRAFAHEHLESFDQCRGLKEAIRPVSTIESPLRLKSQ